MRIVRKTACLLFFFIYSWSRWSYSWVSKKWLKSAKS